MIYLDHNATTPVLPAVFEAMRPYFCDEWGNPSSSYRFGSKIKGVIENAREQVAGLIGAQPREVLFTSCATESNNAAIQAALNADPAKRHIITSSVEHSSVLTFCRRQEKFGFHVTYLPVDRDGLLDLSHLEAAIKSETAVISLMWANNETGVLFPVEKVAHLCRARGVLFHCDAVQAIGKIPVNLAKVPIDYLSITGHKINAPKGVGALYVNRKAPFTPYVQGGHQEQGRRGGTESVPLIAALGKASELARTRLAHYKKNVGFLRDQLEEGILTSVPLTELNGHKTARLCNTTNITFRGIESEALLLLLDQASICASSGSACLADSPDPSHVVRAMKPDAYAARQMIRFSLGSDTTEASVAATIRAAQQSAALLRG
jgi:cysteine desulfurase